MTIILCESPNTRCIMHVSILNSLIISDYIGVLRSHSRVHFSTLLSETFSNIYVLWTILAKKIKFIILDKKVIYCILSNLEYLVLVSCIFYRMNCAGLNANRGLCYDKQMKLIMNMKFMKVQRVSHIQLSFSASKVRHEIDEETIDNSDDILNTLLVHGVFRRKKN